MQFRVQTVDGLHQYLSGVSERGDDHAPEVRDVVAALAGFVIRHKDPGTEILARTYLGEVRNEVWVWINGTHSFSYNYERACIDMRRDSHQGPTVGSFTNRTSVQTLGALFRTLAGSGAAAA